MVPNIKKWANLFLDFFMPHTCIFCRSPSLRNIALCVACEEDLPFVHHSCVCCGVRLPRPALLCGACIQKPPPFDRTIALFDYQPPIPRVISDLKFRGQLSHIPWIAYLFEQRLLAAYSASITPTSNQSSRWPECIIPIPLHRSRLIERGFNQSLEIAKKLSKQLDIPLDIESCQRIRPTKQQSTLSTTERKKNIRNAFTVNRSRLQASHIAILDDVMTTGNTVRELSRMLKRAGVLRIDIWCCARTSEW